MLQQMIIFDGDDAGTGYNETGKRERANDMKASRGAIN